MIAPDLLYPTPIESIIMLFDVRTPGTAERLHCERATWAQYADIEAIDHNHYVLIIRPGGALHGE